MSLSSDEDVPIPSGSVPLQANSHKKRRVQNQRACDRCRQKKIRCDGNSSGSRCSHCSSCGSECIFTEPTKTRGPPKRYVDSLETRLEKMEGMLSRLYPDGDFSQEMELEGWARSFQPQTPEDQPASHKVAGASKDTSPLHSSLRMPNSPGSYSDDSGAESDSDMRANNEFLSGFGTLCITPGSPRYFGKSSGITLLRSIMSAKTKASNGESPRMQRRPEFWNLPSERDRLRTVKRKYNFPEPELLTSLVTLFFTYVAPVVPLLHRPTFMNAINDGLHLRDDKFGAIVLLVCAIASRYSHDSRTPTEGGELRNAGWKWFCQVEPFSNSVLYGPELHDLQIAALSAMYTHGTLPPQSVWILAGIGLRLAQDVGAHCRRPHYEPPTVESELCKRAFWVLLMIDIWTSSYLGRCCAISEENYDVDLLIECDDEYWENADPALAFKQPPGKPSQVSFFNHMIKINLLHSYALRTIYSFNKYSVVMTPREKGWEEQTVASLDSALNSWFDSVPDHLRWDPQRENQIFFIQSATMRISYYFIQITIHRPFIPSFRKESSLSFPALAICGSAARAISHIAEAMRKRYPTFAAPTILLPTFVAGVILLVSLWGAKRSGTSPDPERDMQDVRKCIKLLEMAETRWTVAGRLRDLLTDLSTAGELMVPADSPPSNKREREGSDDEDSQSSPTPHVQIHPHRSASQGSSPYPPVPTAQADSSAPRTPTGSVMEFIPLRTAAVKQEVQPNMPGYSVPPTNHVPKPYGGNYVPLYGSSGLGRMTPVISTPASVPPASSFGPTPSLSGSPSFSPPPMMYDNSRTLPLSTGVGAAQPPGISMMLTPHGLYDPATSAPPSAPASISSSSSSPHCGSQPGTDFGTSAGGDGVLDVSTMEMGFGGYSVPTADKEAMLRHFAPVLLQDGQIGVDRDTMMMWSEMPATFDTHDWEAYMSSMLGLSATNATDPGARMDAGGRLI